MCGRYALEVDVNFLIERYHTIINEKNFLQKEEVFPTDLTVIVRENKGRELSLMKWGFMPSFATRPIINGRSETLDSKPTFKIPFLYKRCIIPATSFYEWEKVGDKKVKRKIFIENEKVFSMAGLYNTFKDKEGKEYEAFTIITTEANDTIKRIHHRMPVILPKDKEDEWLRMDNKDLLTLKEMLYPLKERLIIE